MYDEEDEQPLREILGGLNDAENLVIDNEDRVTYYMIRDTIYRFDEDAPDDD